MTKMSEKMMNIAMLTVELTTLRAARESWQNGTYKRSNDELYDILQRCDMLLVQLRGEVKLRKRLNDTLEALGITVRSNTSLELKVIWAVFGVENKRTHAYARVLRLAHTEKPKNWTLKEWIEEAGGIEEVRRTPKEGVTPTEKARMQRDTAEEKLATANAIAPRFEPTETLQPAEGGDYAYSVALVRIDKDGKASLVFGTNKTALVKAVLTEAGQVLTQRKEEEDAVKTKQDARMTRDRVLAASDDELNALLAA
jgi:hypothetical protein